MQIWRNLKYPYGIWNNPTPSAADPTPSIWSIPMGFETPYYKFLLIPDIYLKYPYGIWNLPEIEIKPKKMDIWSIPMGFETHFAFFQSPYSSLFEVSLWDLKPHF